jgi:hypothetical protein
MAHTVDASSPDDQVIARVQRAATAVRAMRGFFAMLEDVATRDPYGVLRVIWDGVRFWRRIARRELICRFGYDPLRPDPFLKRRRGHWPRLRERGDSFRYLERDFWHHSRAMGRMEAAVRLARARGDDQVSAAMRAWIAAEWDAVRLVADQMAPWNAEHERVAASEFLAGYAHAHVNPRYGRLRRKLGPGDDHERRRELARQLPGFVYGAWAGGAARGDIAALPREAERMITEDMPARAYRRRGAGSAYDPSSVSDALRGAGFDPDVVAWLDRLYREPARRRRRGATNAPGASGSFVGAAAFEALETAARAQAVEEVEMSEAVERLTTEFGLPERRAQVYYLHEVEGWKHRRIAEHLGIKEPTSRAHLNHATRQLSAAP